MQVFATSRDTGINAEITYNIIAGNEQEKFRIDDTTGTYLFHGYLPVYFEGSVHRTNKLVVELSSPHLMVIFIYRTGYL